MSNLNPSWIELELGLDFDNTYILFLDGRRITWKKEDKMLVVDEEVLGDNIDVEKTDDGSIITIENAEEEDGGEYVCHVLDEELAHIVNIISKASINFLPSVPN